ncbi:MAG: hypothetical protein AAGN66_06385 [Acidobacteriota bacterium]
MRRSTQALAVLLPWALALSAASADGPRSGSAAARGEAEDGVASEAPLGEADRIVAVVDEDPIFLSDIERAVALGVADDLVAQDSDPARLRRRVLGRLVEQRLRSHEADRYDTSAVPSADVDRQVETIAERFGGDGRLRERLVELGYGLDDLRALLRRRLRVLAYIEERLAPRVFVEEEDIRAYYDTELAVELELRGLDRPPLAELREPIRVLLRERALDAEIERWTDELRLRADVVDLLERGPLDGPLPPVIWRSGG